MAQVKFYKGAFGNYPASPDANGLYYLELTDAAGAKVYGQVKDGAGRLYTSNVFDASLYTAADSSSKVIEFSTVNEGAVSDASLEFYPISKDEFDAITSGLSAAAITLEGTDSSDYAKVYTLKQGDTTIGTIDIPKDMVVSSGTVVTNPEGQAEGTYIELTLANATSDKIYIDVTTLIDEVPITEVIAGDYIDVSTVDTKATVSAKYVSSSDAIAAATDSSDALATAYAVESYVADALNWIEL